MADTNTPAAHSATTDAGTFTAYVTGSEFGTDDETGEPWALLTMLMVTPDGSTFGYTSEPSRTARDFFARIW